MRSIFLIDVLILLERKCSFHRNTGHGDSTCDFGQLCPVGKDLCVHTKRDGATRSNFFLSFLGHAGRLHFIIPAMRACNQGRQFVFRSGGDNNHKLECGLKSAGYPYVSYSSIQRCIKICSAVYCQVLKNQFVFWLVLQNDVGNTRVLALGISDM